MRGGNLNDLGADVVTSAHVSDHNHYPPLTRGTIIAIEHGWVCTIQPTDGSAPFTAPIGCVEPYITPEQAEATRVGCRAAGYMFGSREEHGRTWWQWRKGDVDGSHAYNVHAPLSDGDEPVTYSMFEAFGHAHDCRHCGERINLGFVTRDTMIERKACHTCLFWLEQSEHRTDAAVIDGSRGRSHYRLGTGLGPSSTRGMLGAHHRLRVLATGQEIDNSDLWYQGIIPDRFLELFPTTHEFVR